MSSLAIDAIGELFKGIFSWKVMVAAAELAWFPVYFLIFREAFRTKSSGMPLVGMCGVLVQCFIYGTFGPYWRPDLFPHNPEIPGSFGVVWVWRGWFFVQAFALYQFFKYHDPAKHQYDVAIAGVNLKWLVVMLLALNLFGQWTFITYFHDVNVNASDPISYLFLAVGFVLLAVNRPDHTGLSYPAAWLKFFATAVIFASTFVHPSVSYQTISTQPTTGYARAVMRAAFGGARTQKELDDLMSVVGRNDRDLILQKMREQQETILTLWPQTKPRSWFNPDPRLKEIAKMLEGMRKAELQKNACLNREANPLEGCKILTDICGPSYTIAENVRGKAYCPPEGATLLIARDSLNLEGWRLSSPDSIFNTVAGEFALFRTRAVETDRERFPDREETRAGYQTSWSTILGCLIRPAAKLDTPVWQPQLIPTDNVISCVDGTVRLRYTFPLFMSIACVGFDALYVGILWNGRRKRRPAARAGAVGA